MTDSTQKINDFENLIAKGSNAKEPRELNVKTFRMGPGIGVYSVEGKCVMANEALGSNLGISKDDLTKRNLWQIEPLKQSGLFSAARDVFKSGKDFQKGVWLKTICGRQRHLVFYFSRTVWHEQPHLLVATLSVADDIAGQESTGQKIHGNHEDLRVRREEETLLLVRENQKLQKEMSARLRAETAFRESEERFRQMFEVANEGMVAMDENGQVTFVNKALAKKLGYEPREMLDQSMTQYIFPDDLDHYLEQIEYRKRGEATRYERRFCHKGGREVWTIVSATPTFSESGIFTGSFAMVTDITDRKVVEQALLESEQKNRVLVEESPLGIAIFQDDKLAYANPRLFDMFGYDSTDRVLGLSPESFVAAKDRDLVTQRRKERLQGKTQPRNYEVTAIRKNGESFPVETWPRLINYQGRLSVMAFFTDQSESKSLRNQLNQAQKMEAIGTLASGIAHDFNNILQVVLGYSDLLLIEPSIQDSSKENLQIIAQAAQSGADLASRLLTFSRKADFNPRRVNLNVKIEDLRKFLSRTIPKMIEIELQLTDNLADVNADPIQMEQVLMNLAINAKDAMPNGGKLFIETMNMTLEQQSCKALSQGTSETYVLISVSDTGYGMDKETVSHIFEPFFTTKTPGQGTGLGLAMVYSIVKQHKGYICCDSEPGIGTTFGICLPATFSEAIPELPAHGQVLRGGTETILVVDDDDQIRSFLCELCNKVGYTTHTAENGKKALEFIKDMRQKIDMVILDLAMPQMGGMECLEGILKMDPDAKVLVASGLTLEETEKRSILSRTAGLLAKPFNINQVLQVIRTVLDFN